MCRATYNYVIYSRVVYLMRYSGSTFDGTMCAGMKAHSASAWSMTTSATEYTHVVPSGSHGEKEFVIDIAVVGGNS